MIFSLIRELFSVISFLFSVNWNLFSLKSNLFALFVFVVSNSNHLLRQKKDDPKWHRPFVIGYASDYKRIAPSIMLAVPEM